MDLTRSRKCRGASRAILIMFVLCLTLVGCSGEPEPSYLKELRGASPPNTLPAALKTNGPFSRPIFRIAIDETRAAVVTEAGARGQYMIWSTNDLRNWNWRAFTPAIPSAVLPRDRLYWFVKGALLSADYANQVQPMPFPYDGAISDLAPDGSSFLAVSGTSGLYGLSETGHWSTLATVGASEQLTTVTHTAQGICAVAANTRNVWFWTDPKSNAVSGALPATAGSPKQIVSTSQHTYMLTETSLLEGDLTCGSWKETSLPPETGERYSVASGVTDLYLATASGLYRYDGSVWSPFPTQITRALVRRLRAINGTLYACHSGGLAESSDFGQTWKPAGKPIGVGPHVEDVVWYQGALYAATEQGLYKRDQPDGDWNQVSLPLAAPTHLRTIVSDDQGHLLIAGEGTLGKNAIWVLDRNSAQWVTATLGLENVHGFGPFQAIAGVVYAPSDVGLLRLDVNSQKWIPDPNNGVFGTVTAVGGFGAKGMLLATGTHDLWYTDDAVAHNPQWKRFLDTSTIQNYLAPINDLWSDPKDHDDSYFATYGQLLFSRDRQVASGNPPKFSEGFSFAAIPRGNSYLLFVGNDFGVDYVDRKYTPKSFASDLGSNISRLQSSYRQNSEKWWFWPINAVLAAIGFYGAAVMSVLALLYLPIPRGLIGTEWLTTQIAKFVAISPFLGRWILFIGYPKRVARQIAGRVNLADGNNYQIVSGHAKGSDLLDQVSNALSTVQFVLIEHSVFPGFPEYLTIRYLRPRANGAPLPGVLPILIPASEWKDSLSKTASLVLKSKYGVPLDEEDMVKGQIERGNLLVIFENVDELGDKLAELVSEIESAIETRSLEKCYFIACCASVTTQMSNQTTVPIHLVARKIQDEASAPKT